MNFKEEIRQNIVSYGKCVNVYSNKEIYPGHGIFNQIAKNKEQYYNAYEPEEIGMVDYCIFSVWLVISKKIKNINHIVCNNKKYDVIYEKFREETGCFELIVVERS